MNDTIALKENSRYAVSKVNPNKIVPCVLKFERYEVINSLKRAIFKNEENDKTYEFGHVDVIKSNLTETHKQEQWWYMVKNEQEYMMDTYHPAYAEGICIFSDDVI